MKSFRKSMDRIAHSFSRPGKYSRDPNRLNLEKNQYVYDPELRALVPIEAEDETTDDDEYEPLDSAARKIKRFSPTGYMVAANGVRVDTISPEFGRMYNRSIVAPMHSYIGIPYTKLISNTVVLGRRYGNLDDFPDARGIPKRSVSESDANRPVPPHHLTSVSLDTFEDEKSVDDSELTTMISEGTQVTNSLFFPKNEDVSSSQPQKLVPLHATISEPIDHYSTASEDLKTSMGVTNIAEPAEFREQIPIVEINIDPITELAVEPKPIPEAKPPKKSVKWGTWSLLEFMTANDNWENPADLERSHSQPHIAVQNLDKCPVKSILHGPVAGPSEYKGPPPENDT